MEEGKNELIILEQLPIIKTKLEQISKEIQEKVDNATSLIVNEDTVKEVKKVRANLTKEFNELETQRKQVKQAIMSKYDEFEDIYKENVSNLYKQADATLKDKIDSVENELKQEKEKELREFVEEHCKARQINVAFEVIGLNITLSASMKSLKEQASAFIEKVDNDLKLINMEEYSSEILYEYNKTFNFVDAKTKVIERHKELEEIKKQQEKKEEQQKQDEEIVHNIETLVSAPVEIKEEEKNWYEFSALMTNTQAKELKEWFRDRNIEMR